MVVHLASVPGRAMGHHHHRVPVIPAVGVVEQAPSAHKGAPVAAAAACGAVSLLSPVPGQLATLCAGLNVSGHGITAPPASDLLAHRYQRRKTGTASERRGCAAAAIMLPDLDGIRLAILGLHNYRDNTVVHLHASGPMCDAIHGPAKPVINGQRLIEYASQSIRVNAVSPA